jgi:acetyl-CoA carboxylase biotin carboxyl carrier protein
MERKRTASSVKSLEEPVTVNKQVPVEVVSIAQIQRLVRLLDNSDVSELELKQPGEGIHLVLRKVKTSDGSVQAVVGEDAGVGDGAKAADAAGEVKVVASLVGIFHPWLKPRGGTLAAVGDRVKAGQLVGTIESLNVLTEVETTLAGRVVEIYVEDGQPVEYGQVLMTIEPAEVEDI